MIILVLDYEAYTVDFRFVLHNQKSAMVQCLILLM